MSNAPCKDCVAPKRHLGCHGECKEYIEFKKGISDLTTTIRKEKELNTLLNGYNKNKISGLSHSHFGKK